MRYEHPDPAFAAVVTELLRSTSRVKPLERRLKAIEEKAMELPAEPELCRKAAFHACLALTKGSPKKCGRSVLRRERKC